MEPVTGMAALVADVGILVTSAITWLGAYCSAITASGNEILVLGAVAVPLVGLGAGLLRRLISVKV